MPRSVIGICKTQLQVEAAISRLRSAGGRTEEVSLVMLERNGILGLARDRDSRLDGGKAQQSAPAGPAGGVLGMLTGLGMVTLPGAGSHITAGPLATLVGQSAGSAGICGIADSLVIVGMPLPVARQYEQLVRQGNILLAALATDEEQAKRFSTILREARAEDVRISEPAITLGASA